ncbi:hypothetical protein HJC23_002938 [Cyclotella cryptica]|uniref:Peptidase S54 rhomboid domain-containing protein n=1 Tax=Cyclotella cryptica TaxID=29204 RepID=A0ABD3PR79_9STRA|eukprot:CCRYP_012465-RA/>CCRYP_012465-RA protein AED:0.02 eAED:0.02 QI:0/0/0/1/1/1/2/0/766
MSGSTWQTPLFKLIVLLVILPWTVTYLHLYYHTFWQYEYCLVGPPTSIFSTTRWNEYNVAADVEANDNPKIRTINNEIDVMDLYGIYAPQSQKKKKGESELDRRIFRQMYSTGRSSKNRPVSSLPSNSYLSMNSSGWPSLTQAAMMISGPSSTLSKYSYVYDGQDVAKNNQHEILFFEQDNEQIWCLQSTATGDKWCSSPLNQYPKGTIYQYPPGGTWYHSSSSESKPPISISCPTPSTILPSTTKTKHHKQQNAKQNQNVKFLLHHPTTTLLLLLNTFLAYQYWNHRIPPSSVCKSYNKICNQHEWWRSFTGATAHFEPLHIGFNMMSLHTLGKELEGGFGSVIFLVYNIALVVMCTMVMMGMVYGRLVWARYRSNGEGEGVLQEKEKRLKETSTVGYSGVLFAWMVITTLERNQATCPIPFFSDVCFSTHHVPGISWLKFNVAPIVSLFVAQFIMPRVSFMGHLAGIACGFGLHWGWGMPPLEVCSPNVLIGGVYLVFCLGVSRRLIPVMLSSNEIVDIEDNTPLRLEGGEDVGDVSSQNSQVSCITDSVTEDAIMTGKRRKKERELDEVRRKQRTLLFIRNLIGLSAVTSAFLFDFTSSLVLSQTILFAHFVFGTQASCIVWTYLHINRADNDIIDQEKRRLGVLWRGFIVTATLVIVVDSMSMASWVVLNTFISADRSPRATLVSAYLFMIIRTSTNILGLVVSSKVLHDFGQVGGGIFLRMFSRVLSSSKKVGDGLFLSSIPLWTAFEGKGIRLGSSARST